MQLGPNEKVAGSIPAGGALFSARCWDEGNGRECLMLKYILLGLILTAISMYCRATMPVRPGQTELAAQQLSKDMSAELNQKNLIDNMGWNLAWWAVIATAILCLIYDGKNLLLRYIKAPAVATIALLLLTSTGCWKPFEPIKLETITTNEEAFLIPLVGDASKQGTAKTEEFLSKNLVFTKQVRIPQQWVPKGYETWVWRGVWQDAAVLIKVDKAPVTREWTADENSGTSKKNEAIWVMTSDQVEFSTGWTCTARIANREESIKFLYNYPNGSLEHVMDHELRAKLQAEWTEEVTDLSMDEMRKAATPHIDKVRKKVIDFFKERGIEITNLGITGGFVYKDPKIQATMVEVFNSEQKKSIAKAGALAQQEENAKIQLEADAESKALLTKKKAEADGIKMMADAKAYEIEKAKQDAASYIQLKRIELEKEKITKWDGRYPSYYMDSSGKSPEMLLTVPSFEPKK